MALDPLALDDRNTRYVTAVFSSLFFSLSLINQVDGSHFSMGVFHILYLPFSDECFVKPCSSKATSVIRLASQKSPKPLQSSADTARPANRQSVKKLVVKLKKPFVPVIEEEANLHPPGE